MIRSGGEGGLEAYIFLFSLKRWEGGEVRGRGETERSEESADLYICLKLFGF
jgi:hypothetical protein